MGSLLCEHCLAACCRYIALPLDKPTTVRDFDDIRWYLMHQGISVFVEEGDWYVQFQTRCKNLGMDNRCEIYDSRPQICRTYEPGECDYAGGTYGYDNLFVCDASVFPTTIRINPHLTIIGRRTQVDICSGTIVAAPSRA